jgi:hypothetical protein
MTNHWMKAPSLFIKFHLLDCECEGKQMGIELTLCVSDNRIFSIGSSCCVVVT